MDFASKFAPSSGGSSYGGYGSTIDANFEKHIVSGQYNVNGMKPPTSFGFYAGGPSAKDQAAAQAATKLKAKMLIECGLPKVPPAYPIVSYYQHIHQPTLPYLILTSTLTLLCP